MQTILMLAWEIEHDFALYFCPSGSPNEIETIFPAVCGPKLVPVTVIASFPAVFKVGPGVLTTLLMNGLV